MNNHKGFFVIKNKYNFFFLGLKLEKLEKIIKKQLRVGGKHEKKEAKSFKKSIIYHVDLVICCHYWFLLI